MKEAQQLTKQMVPKLWGYEEWLVNNGLYCGKMLHIRPGFKSSLHYHNVKDETFVALEGFVKLEWKTPKGDLRIICLRGEERNAVRLPPGTPHRFWAPDEKSTVLEFSTQHDDSDVVRLEESYEIKPERPRGGLGFKSNPEIEEKFQQLQDAIGEEIELEIDEDYEE